MSQSSVLVGLLAAMFLVYIAAKGRLPNYTATLWGKKSGGSGSGGSGGTADTIKTAAKVAEVVAPFLV